MYQKEIFEGINKDSIRKIALSQDRGDWCWAACIQMMLKFDGIEISQLEIVSSFIDVYTTYDQRVEDGQIKQIIDDLPIIKSINSKTKSKFEVKYINLDKGAFLLDHISDFNRPIMLSYMKDHLGASAHIVIIAGVNYIIVESGRQINQLFVIDPEANPLETRIEGIDMHCLIGSECAIWLTSYTN